MHSSLQRSKRTLVNGSSDLIIQPKLTVNNPGDKYEQEADLMADNVMSISGINSVQRKCAKCEEEEEKQVQRKPISPSFSPLIHTKNGTGTTTDSSSTDKISSSKSSGYNMDKDMHSFMSSRFGFDFSKVKIHSDNGAAQMNRELNARAFTVGNDIYFNQGEYQPQTAKGRHLLAHELTHTLQQRKNTDDVIRRKCDVDSALKYYGTATAGKKIDYAEWLEKMRKIVGRSDKLLFEGAKNAGTIGKEFVLLVCKGQDMLKITEDGKIGGATQTAFETFSTGGEKGIDYSRLFKDKKLEVGIAIGDEFKGEGDAIVSLLETAGKKEKNFSSTDLKDRRVVKFTKAFSVQGDNTAAPVEIDLVFEIVGPDSTTPKKTFTEFLSQKEIAIYSGHARYGTGPDFDDKKSVKENFIIGVNSALHKAGKLKAGYDAHMNEILKGQANDLEAMSKGGKIDPNTYQVWFFNACSTINYLDEVRNGLVTDKAGKTKSKANLRFVGTNYSIYSNAVKIVEAIVNMKSMEEIIRIMNANEQELVKRQGETPKKNYYFSN